MPFVQHPSVRVPWHGGGWKGTVCEDPAARHACMLLGTIGTKRDDQFEAAHSGQDWDILDDRLPPCELERGAFLSDHVATRKHPYAWNLKELEPARRALPAHSGSVGCFPRPASSCSCAALWLSRQACFGGPATVRGTPRHAIWLSRSGVLGTTVGWPLLKAPVPARTPLWSTRPCAAENTRKTWRTSWVFRPGRSLSDATADARAGARGEAARRGAADLERAARGGKGAR